MNIPLLERLWQIDEFLLEHQVFCLEHWRFQHSALHSISVLRAIQEVSGQNSWYQLLPSRKSTKYNAMSIHDEQTLSLEYWIGVLWISWLNITPYLSCRKESWQLVRFQNQQVRWTMYSCQHLGDRRYQFVISSTWISKSEMELVHEGYQTWTCVLGSPASQVEAI